MSQNNIEFAFKQAVEKVNQSSQFFPPDVLLRLYAYYKKANNYLNNPKETHKIIHAFKCNALFQTKDINAEEAKKAYIEEVERIFLKFT